jgi:hypothetical protein
MLKDLPRACEGETDAFQAPHKSKYVHIKDLLTCEGIWCIIKLNNCMLWGNMLRWTLERLRRDLAGCKNI